MSAHPPTVVGRVDEPAHSITPRLIGRRHEQRRTRGNRLSDGRVGVIDIREDDAWPRWVGVTGLTEHHDRISDQHIGVLDPAIRTQAAVALLAPEDANQELDELVDIVSDDVRIETVIPVGQTHPGHVVVPEQEFDHQVAVFLVRTERGAAA